MPEGFSPTALGAFELFFRPWMKRRVRLALAPLPPLPLDRTLILAANHTSWWDPFALRELHRCHRPRTPLYTLMLEHEVASRPFFRRIGIVGIQPDSVASVRSAIRVLERRTTANPGATVTFFPQGRIWPATRRPLGFRRGIDLFARSIPDSLVLPVAVRVEALNAVKPTVFVLPGQPFDAREVRSVAERCEREVTHLLDRIDNHLQDFGEEAPLRWPPNEPAG